MRIRNSLLVLCILSMAAASRPAFTPSDALFNAVAQVESGGNPKARNSGEDAVGVVQIRRIYVDDANRIEKLNHGSRQWTYADRYDAGKSREMFDVYVLHYSEVARRKGRTVNDELMARIHNGGPDGYDKPATQGYWAKVKREMERAEKK